MNKPMLIGTGIMLGLLVIYPNFLAYYLIGCFFVAVIIFIAILFNLTRALPKKQQPSQ